MDIKSNYGPSVYILFQKSYSDLSKNPFISVLNLTCCFNSFKNIRKYPQLSLQYFALYFCCVVAFINTKTETSIYMQFRKNFKHTMFLIIS